MIPIARRGGLARRCEAPLAPVALQVAGTSGSVFLVKFARLTM